MEALDCGVIGVFFLALIGIIVWVVRQKQNDSADYFLGGRDATWLAIGASILASNIGTLDRTGRRRSLQWYGDGSLGNSGMDDSDSGMGVRSILYTKHGIYNAGISGTPL